MVSPSIIISTEEIKLPFESDDDSELDALDNGTITNYCAACTNPG